MVFKVNPSDVVKPYKYTTDLCRGASPASETIGGFALAQPDWLPDGYNLFTNGGCDGVLNLHCRYNDDGTHPVSAWQINA